MKKIIFALFSFCVLLSSCSEEGETFYYDMYLAIEVVDNQGNDLLGSSSPLIHPGETKIKIGENYYYLNSQENDPFTFRHIQSGDKSYLKIGCWYYDRKDIDLSIDWGGGIKKDVIVFSYDSPLNGSDPSHDFRYPYSITINGKEPQLDNESGHFIYVKETNL